MSLDFRRISQIQFFRTLRDPECNTLEDLIRRWRQTAFALLGNKGVEFTAPAEAEIARIELTSDRRRQLLLLFNEASATRAPRRGRLRMDRSPAVIMPAGSELALRIARPAQSAKAAACIVAGVAN